MSAEQVSPRTDAEPLAFTADEFLRGTVASWIAFNVLFGPTLAVIGSLTTAPGWGPSWSVTAIVLIYVVPIALVASGVVTLLCCGAAWLLGRVLRRRRAFALHAICFALLGAAIGTLVVVVYTLAVDAPMSLANPIAALAIACSAAALPLGWVWTVRRSMRVEAGRSKPPRIDPDAAFEDVF